MCLKKKKKTRRRKKGAIPGPEKDLKRGAGKANTIRSMDEPQNGAARRAEKGRGYNCPQGK